MEKLSNPRIESPDILSPELERRRERILTEIENRTECLDTKRIEDFMECIKVTDISESESEVILRHLGKSFGLSGAFNDFLYVD